MTLVPVDQWLDRLASGEMLISDGAIGTQLLAHGLGFSDLPNGAFDHPDLLRQVHRDYIGAGCDLITSHTFLIGGTVEQVEEGLRIALEEADGADRPVGVLFSLTRDQAADASRANGNALPLFETLTDLQFGFLNDEFSHNSIFGLSCHVNIEGNLLDGSTLTEYYSRAASVGAGLIGVNCGASLAAFVRAVVRSEGLTASAAPMIVQPSLGLPEIDEAGKSTYSVTPSEFAEAMAIFRGCGNLIVGGCCGTTPAHIAAMRAVLLM